jgi:hypothetical protein
VLAGLDRHLHLEHAVDLLGHVEETLLLLLAADGEQLQAGAVEPDVHVVDAGFAAHAVGHRRPLHLHLDDVFAVGREVMPERRAAAGAERQLLVHPLFLRHRERHLVNLEHRRHVRVGHGQTADVLRRHQVGLEVRRRQRQHVADVVEAGARVVGRQQRPAVDRQPEQIAHGVDVLGAVQAMDHLAPRVRRRCRLAVEALLQEGRERVEHGSLGPRRTGRRHAARPDLANHLLPHLGARAEPIQVVGIQRQVRGLRPLVVTGDAVLRHHRLVAAAGRRGAGVRGLRGGVRGRGSEEEGDPRREESHAHISI